MKYVVLFVGAGAVLPLALWLRGGKGASKRFWILFGFLPFLLPSVPQLDIAIISWPHWIGLLSGLEVTVVDVFTIAAFFSLPRARSPFPFGLPLLLYILAVCLSVLQADEPVAAIFYVWQVLRVSLLLLVVARICVEPDMPVYLLKGMALGLCLQVLVVVWQRFGLGIVQTAGTFAHQNTLGLVSHFVVFPHLALLLAGRRGWQVAVVPLAGAVVAVLTTSRAALLYACLGIVATYLLSSIRRWTLRKGLIGISAFLLAAALVPLVMASFEKRFELNPLIEHEYDERAAFNRTAALILGEHPFGVGVNHYVYVAKNFGYSERGGVAPVEGSRNNIVHNAYWLTAAETGYPGLAAFVLMLAYPLLVAFRVGWRNRGTRRGDLLIGLGVALLIVYAHSGVEYIVFTKEAQYLFVITVGMVLGLARQLAPRPAGVARPVRRRWARRGLPGLPPQADAGHPGLRVSRRERARFRRQPGARVKSTSRRGRSLTHAAA